MKNIRSVLMGIIGCGVLALIASCESSSSGGGTTTYTVGGTLAGSTGTVALKLNGGSDISMSADGNFSFTGVASGATYNVQIVAPNQRCTVTNGAGTMGAADVANVAVSCVAQVAQMVVRSARLNGSGENPPTMSNATGVGGVIVDPTDTDINGDVLITGGITFSGLTPTAGGHHIHRAPIGDPTGNGAVIIGLLLASDGVTAVVPPGARLTPAQYTALLAGELYFNVHSTNNLCPPALNCAAGEIRGQIHLQGGVIGGVADLDGAQEVPSSSSTATGKGTVIVDRATRNILITYVTHDVANASAAHIHTSPSGAGSNGGIIVGFSTLQTNFDLAGTNLVYPPAGSQMTAQNVTDFLANYLYFNVHSTNNLCPPAADCGAGEIRGNIAPLQ